MRNNSLSVEFDRSYDFDALEQEYNLFYNQFRHFLVFIRK